MGVQGAIKKKSTTEDINPNFYLKVNFQSFSLTLQIFGVLAVPQTEHAELLKTTNNNNCSSDDQNKIYLPLLLLNVFKNN